MDMTLVMMVGVALLAAIGALAGIAGADSREGIGDEHLHHEVRDVI